MRSLAVKHGIAARLRARLDRIREQHEWVNHVARAGQRYFAQRGNHFAAAITFFSILTAVPLLMIAFAAASYVLWFNPTLLAELEGAIADAVPSGLAQAVNPILETAIEQRNSVAGIGLIGALWSGVWWMSNLREAVSAQWELPAPNPAALQRLLFDLRALAGLGIALVVTLGFTVLGTGLTEAVLRLLGAPDDGFTRALLRVVGVVLGVAANWLIVAWAITRLPRTDVTLRGVRRAALLGAIGFEALKQGATVYFEVITSTPGGAVFGSLLGLLLFGYLMARLLLWVTAWAATARGNERVAAVPVPGPVVLRQEVVVGRGASAGGLGAALALGVVAGVWLRGKR
jgi:membrane protein